MPAPTTDEILEALWDQLGSPKSVTVDGQTVVARDAKDFLDMQAAIAAQDAATQGRSGLRFFQFTPPGAGGTP